MDYEDFSGLRRVRGGKATLVSFTARAMKVKTTFIQILVYDCLPLLTDTRFSSIIYLYTLFLIHLGPDFL